MSVSKWLYLYLITISTGCAQREVWLPDSTLSPREAVEIQLKAFQENPFPTSDFGIKTAWEFASPANKTITGPYDRFHEMLLSEKYYPLLMTREYSIDEHFDEENYAEYFVVIRTNNDQRVHYVFDLSFQSDNHCWMVDAVLLMPEQFQPNPKSVATAEGFQSSGF